MKISWSTEQVIKMAGLDPDQVSPDIIHEADCLVEEFYYLQHAAEALMGYIDRRRYWVK